jgi:hypothetical protein
MRIRRTACVAGVPLAVALLIGWLTPSTGAYSNYFYNECAVCHSHMDDAVTCNGCHFHRGTIRATADQPFYDPGATVTVTMTGGTKWGWIRGLLYDQNGTQIDIATGPTGTGDDGLGNPVVFPVALQAPAPEAPGDYAWRAAYFGSYGGSNHGEVSTPVTIHVVDSGAVPEGAPLARGFSISPNPLRDWSTLRFTAGPQGETVGLAILDATGRRVRRLWNAAVAPGDHQLTWDATDDGGRPVPAGTYFAVLTGEAGRVVRALNVMR